MFKFFPPISSSDIIVGGSGVHIDRLPGVTSRGYEMWWVLFELEMSFEQGYLK